MVNLLMKLIHFFIKIKINKTAIVGKNFGMDGWKPQIINSAGDPSRIVVGDNFVLAGMLAVSPNGSIKIGNYSYVNIGSIVASSASIEIGNYVSIAQNVHIFDNNTHPIEPEARIIHRKRVAPGGGGYSPPLSCWDIADKKPIVIKDNVWIGMYSYIGKGVTIGEGAVVARNSVVTKDVPPYCVVAGNPAKIVKLFEQGKQFKNV